MYWRSSGPNRSSRNRRCPTTGKLRRMACFFWVRSCAATPRGRPRRARRRASTSWSVCTARSAADARSRTRSGTFRAWISSRSPTSWSSAASNVAHKVLYGGLADLRPMPRTLIDDGHAARGLPLPARREGPARQGDPVLLVTPLAAPALCFDLRRGCSLVEHFVDGGRPTYLVEYGQVSFKDRNLGMEHWIDEVVPAAIREVSAHAGGRPVHVVGWSLGGIFALLTAADQPGPADRVAHRRRLAGRREEGAAGGADAAAAQPHRRPGRDHPRLPGAGRGPEAAGDVGLPAVVVPEAGHQAAGDR